MQRKERVNGAETKIDEQPHYYALRVQKLALDFNNGKSYDETIKTFRQHYNGNPVVSGVG